MLARLVRSKAPSTWAGFLALVDDPDRKLPDVPEEDAAQRAEDISKFFLQQQQQQQQQQDEEGGALPEAEFTVVFENAHRAPVALPIGCVATRIGDPVIVDALFKALSWQEIMRAVVQDIADDHRVGLEALARSSATGSVGSGHRGWAVIVAVERRAARGLPAVLQWAHAAGALSVLCSDPQYHEEDVWHLPVFENALQLAVRQSAAGLSSTNGIMHGLLNTPLAGGIYPLSANQKMRVLIYCFEQCDEASLNAYLHRFPELTNKVGTLRFSEANSESLRRRCIYQLFYEPRDSGH